jgi:His/Glu/Gln/Arg/opine family amino acid ABC transporter permease subunit
MFDDTALWIRSLPFLLQGALVTLQIAAAAVAVGFCGGTLIGVLNCRKKRTTVLGGLFDAFVWCVRGTPLFVQVLIAYYALPEVIGVSIAPFWAGVIALGVNSTAYVSEIVRGGIDAIPDGQWDASQVLGLSPWHTLKGIILPQAFQITLPGLTNELTSLIKETSILMTIGVAELTKVSKDIVARELDPISIYLTAAAIYLAITTLSSMVPKLMKKKEA